MLDGSNKPARLTSGNISLSAAFNSESFKPKKFKTADNQELKLIGMYPGAYVDFNIPWSLNINYNLVYSKPQFTATTNKTVTYSGDLTIAPKWKIGISSGYNFTQKEVTFTSVDFYRDMHCWEFRFNWIPVGFRKSFLFTINVKSSTLKDLKVNKRGNWFDQPL
jgi:hypothetical protein